MTKPKNVKMANGRYYYRWKVAGVDFFRRLPDLASPDFDVAYQSAIKIRNDRASFGQAFKRHAAQSSIIPSVKLHNKRHHSRGEQTRIIPSWLVTLAREARKRASRKSLPFTLDRPGLALLFERSGGCCEVSGLPFNHDAVETLYRPFAASIDQIDAGAGYTLHNVRLVCVIVNAAMNQWGEGPFWAMVESAQRERSRTFLKSDGELCVASPSFAAPTH